MSIRSELRSLRQPAGWRPFTGRSSGRVQELILALILGGVVGLGVFVSTVYLNRPLLLGGLVAGCVFVFLTMRWPEIGILAFVAITGGLVDTQMLPFLDLGPISFHISDLILFVLLGLLFLRATGRPGFRLFESPLTVPLLLFFVAILISIANAIVIYGVALNSVFRMARVLAYWLAFLPTLQLIRDEQSLRRLVAGLWVLAALLVVGVILPGSLSSLGLLPGRIVPLTTAGREIAGVSRLYTPGERLLYVMIPVTIATLATADKGRGWWRAALLAGLLVWLFRSFQRNYWMTAMLSCALLVLLLSAQERLRLTKRLLPLLMVALVVLIAVELAMPGSVVRLVEVSRDRLASLVNDPGRTDPSVRWRLYEDQQALLTMSRHPLLGLGLANSYRPLMVGEGGEFMLDWYAHNAYLWIVVTMGVTGLAPFVWLSIAFVLRVLRWWRKVPDGELRGVFLGFGMAYLGMMVSNLVAPNFLQSWSLSIYPVMMGISEGILRVSLGGGKESAVGLLSRPGASPSLPDPASLTGMQSVSEKGSGLEA